MGGQRLSWHAVSSKRCRTRNAAARGRPSAKLKAADPMEAAPSMAERTHSGWQHLKAILAQRCPRCCEGRLFRGLFAMHRCCPVCGLRFEREQGYFVGAMYVSYPLSVELIGLFLWLAT